jgi:hypothetical protein
MDIAALERLFDAYCSAREIRIFGARDDSRMISKLLVKFEKVAPIARQDDSLLRDTKEKEFLIRPSLICPPNVPDSQNVMATLAKTFNNRQRKVFVGK